MHFAFVFTFFLYFSSSANILLNLKWSWDLGVRMDGYLLSLQLFPIPRSNFLLKLHLSTVDGWIQEARPSAMRAPDSCMCTSNMFSRQLLTHAPLPPPLSDRPASRRRRPNVLRPSDRGRRLRRAALLGAAAAHLQRQQRLPRRDHRRPQVRPAAETEIGAASAAARGERFLVVGAGAFEQEGAGDAHGARQGGQEPRAHRQRRRQR